MLSLHGQAKPQRDARSECADGTTCISQCEETKQTSHGSPSFRTNHNGVPKKPSKPLT
jgi:hypothetical protein